jgi:hypothetical protein
MAERRRRLDTSLPEILADEGRRAPIGRTRVTRHPMPSTRIRWQRGLERLVTDGALTELAGLAEDELRSTIRQLRELEHQVSRQRRAVHEVIDRTDAALAARHKVRQA